MKRFCLVSLLIVYSILAIAQSVKETKDVTRFLGIPVDGSEKEMIKAIQNKGFEITKMGESTFLTGRFNDSDVLIMVQSNNNKVYRIAVCDEITRDKHQIKSRYNDLCYQFEHNDNYIGTSGQSIPADEDIAFEKLKGKNYQAYFFQEPEEEILFQYAHERVRDKYTEEEIQAMSDEERREKLLEILQDAKMELISNKIVYFAIVGGENEEEYRIVIYYENEYNKSNGRDL